MALDFLAMDASVTAIGLGATGVVVLISYIIFKFGIRETSFEQVLEEQKKRSIEEEQKQKSEKVKKEKKFKKTWSKKTKDKTEPEVASEPEQIMDAKVDSEIEIIEPKEVKSGKQKSKSKPLGSPTQEKAKSKSNASTQKSMDAAPQEKISVSPVSEKPAADKKASNVEKVEILKQTDVKENIQQPATSATSSPVSSVSHKKKKKEPVEKDVLPLTACQLVSFIKGSDLEAEEIQNLIDVLLNKQKDSTGWMKKKDPLLVTKRNLQEKEQMLEQEMKQNQAAISKVKDLREENNTLRTRLNTQEKYNSEKINKMQQDVQALTARNKQLQEHLLAEKEKSSQVEKENEKHSQMTSKHYDAAMKAKEDIQRTHLLLVEQHTKLVTKERQQSCDIERLNSQNKTLTEECKGLQNSLTDANRANKTFEEKLMSEEKQLNDLETQLASRTAEFVKLQSELDELKGENERLAQQLIRNEERAAGDGQEIVHQNGDLNGNAQELPEKLNEKDKLLKEKEFLLTQLNDDLSKYKAKVSLLSDEIEIQKQKNNELREKNWKAMEALTNAEKNAEQKIKEVQLASEKKLAQLDKDISQNAQSETPPDVVDKLRKAESEAAQRLSDYNNEAAKNSQLSFKLDELNEQYKCRTVELEKNVQVLKTNLVNFQSETKECLQRICPSVSVNSSLPFEKWLLEFERQALDLTKNSESATELQQLIVQKEKEYLEKQRHYEDVLQETETTLLSLQNSAESQERVWQERLNAKERQLEQIVLERDALATEKEAVQSTLQIDQLEELQEKLKLLQSTLENAENEKSHVELKYEEVNKNCLNLRDQLENKEKQISELQKQSNSHETLHKEIEELKAKLQKEKKISSDFSSQMIRLNSLVKIGQDALHAEQEMVKKLKVELEAAQVSTTNGSAPIAKESPLAVSESQTTIKKPEKPKKRMAASDKK